MPFALVIMGVIIVLAFLTVVAVIYFGSKENITVHGNGENLASVEAWMKRAERANPPASEKPAPAKEREAAEAAEAVADEDAPESSTASAASDSGQSVGDLSDEEREAKRQAALERRKARAAKRAESNDS